MNSLVIEQVDEQVSSLLAGKNETQTLDPRVLELIAVADHLRYLPRAGFRQVLRAELREEASRMRTFPHRENAESPSVTDPEEQMASPQFSSLSMPPLDRAHLAASFALHVAALAGALSSGLWMVEHRHEMGRQIVSVLAQPPYILAPARSEAHGGGGGGDRDKTSASRGMAPRFAEQQIVPPAVIVRNEDPKLPAEPTLVGPPDVALPQSSQIGNPLATVLAPSNGSSSGGGIGEGQGGGIGAGKGAGIGTGEGGGFGGGIYNVGGGVSAPRAIYDPDPEYSEEARKAKYQGSVVLQAVIAPDGHPRDLRVVRSVGMGLDEKAVEAVRKWKFEPAQKDGRPVAVLVQIEVAFRLY
jgi:TonB family protein